jgi:hypothetical protein
VEADGLRHDLAPRTEFATVVLGARAEIGNALARVPVCSNCGEYDGSSSVKASESAALTRVNL